LIAVETGAKASSVTESIRILAEHEAGITTFKTLIRHPMETGQREDERSGRKIPAHFIQEVTVEHADRIVFKALWGTGVSANPYLSFKFRGGKPGDQVKLSWVDNMGQSDSLQAVIVKAN
jgi:sulfur-oxidizing protein SoxZ